MQGLVRDGRSTILPTRTAALSRYYWQALESSAVVVFWAAIHTRALKKL